MQIQIIGTVFLQFIKCQKSKGVNPLNYIRYHEAEILFKNHHTFEAILESLSTEIQNFSKEVDEDYIAGALCGGGDGLNVQSSNISDSTSRIAMAYGNDITRDYLTTKNEIKIEFTLVSLILDKLNIAYRQIPQIQQEILRLYYWEGKNWKEVKESLTETRGFIVEKTAQRHRTAGIEKIRIVSRIDIPSYQEVIKFLGK